MPGVLLDTWLVLVMSLKVRSHHSHFTEVEMEAWKVSDLLQGHRAGESWHSDQG